MTNPYFIGEKYSRLTIINIYYKKIGNRKVKYCNCLCECGGSTSTTITKLRSGHTNSCGCFKKEKISKHHKTYSKEYNVWSGMKQRILNKNSLSYKIYGGRGIKINTSWLKFENFFHDMGKRPKGTTIDRINNNGNYCKENCRWATKEQQNNNTSRNVFLEYNNEKLTISQWEKKLNFKPCTVQARIKRGWSVKRALETRI